MLQHTKLYANLGVFLHPTLWQDFGEEAHISVIVRCLHAFGCTLYISVKVWSDQIDLFCLSKHKHIHKETCDLAKIKPPLSLELSDCKTVSVSLALSWLEFTQTHTHKKHPTVQLNLLPFQTNMSKNRSAVVYFYTRGIVMAKAKQTWTTDTAGMLRSSSRRETEQSKIYCFKNV